MVKRLLVLASLFIAAPALAAGGESGVIQSAGNDLGNVNSLQRGARNFMNYCAGCHSASYVRYSRIADDLGIDEDMLRENLMFGVGKVGSTINAAMPEEHANTWFGTVPPDLSLTARARGVDWIYSFLMSFYADSSRTFGVDNMVLKGVAMPHVLADLQGLQAATFEVPESHGDEDPEPVFAGFHPLTEGRLSAARYEEFVRDTANFLDYIGEPVKLERQRLGFKVLAYLVPLFLLAFALKKEFWKDVH